MKKIALTTLLFLFTSSSAMAFNFNIDDLKNIDLNKIAKTGKSISQSVRSFSEEERYYIGRASGARLLSGHRLLKQRALQDYISAIGLTLAMGSSRPELYAGYHFIIINEPKLINAYAMPGGFIFITTGLIRKAASEDELAAVLAHEVAHLVLDHPIGSVKSQYRNALMKDILAEAGKNASKQAQKVAKLAGGLNNLSNMMVDFAAKGYSRSKEEDADMEAITILKSSGYDPKALPSILAKLHSIGTGISGTHGNAKARAQAVTKELNHQKKRSIVKARTKRFALIKK
ncbi:MAG: M48 family metalloprotease [Mariprofundus sp.]|nr:M48 family metalloprotease [Mariprofundus sp.]